MLMLVRIRLVVVLLTCYDFSISKVASVGYVVGMALKLQI